MTLERDWVTVYDVEQGFVTITLAEQATQWETFELDAEVSS